MKSSVWRCQIQVSGSSLTHQSVRRRHQRHRHCHRQRHPQRQHQLHRLRGREDGQLR